MRNFWAQLSKPFFILAPLEDVTDAAFRVLIARLGKPAVMFTEFTSADGLVLADAKGLRKLMKKLQYDEIERPIVAQLFTASPEHMKRAAELVSQLGFDGIDINMGCPVREVVDNQCGAALIKNPDLAREIIRAAKSTGLPVSIKTRLGYDSDALDEWLPELLAEEPEAITIHARTRKEMSDVPARWDRIARAVEIRDSLGSKTLIVGNGDVVDVRDAGAKVAETKCDGVMLGRAIFGNPWLFSNSQEFRNRSREEKVRALIEHIELFQNILSGYQNDAVMKRHFKAYISGWNGAKELRQRLMDAPDLRLAKRVLVDALSHAGYKREQERTSSEVAR